MTPPCFELYNVCATLQDVGIRECKLDFVQDDFELPVEQVQCVSYSKKKNLSLTITDLRYNCS